MSRMLVFVKLYLQTCNKGPRRGVRSLNKILIRAFSHPLITFYRSYIKIRRNHLNYNLSSLLLTAFFTCFLLPQLNGPTVRLRNYLDLPMKSLVDVIHHSDRIGFGW